jgi:DNA-directed RNA polymerase specialized sigma24 family protein
MAAALRESSMSNTASVTFWIGQLRDGDSQAAHKLWAGYFHRLVSLARAKLKKMPRRSADEEDVALSAFDSFIRGAQAGRFPRLDDRDDLWQVLFLITERKSFDLIEHEGRQKRDWRMNQAIDSEHAPIDLAGNEPDPAFAAQVAEECERLLKILADDELRLIAVRKMEGYANTEIAAELGCSLAKVERKLRRIREEWSVAEKS